MMNANAMVVSGRRMFSGIRSTSRTMTGSATNVHARPATPHTTIMNALVCPLKLNGWSM